MSEYRDVMATRPVPLLDPKQTARFQAKVHRQAITECWEWTAHVSTSGYGLFRVGKRMVSAHRLAYFLGNKTQPGELHVLHRCDNKLCCNPTHLFLGTNRDNIDDYAAKGLSRNLGHTQIGERNGHARLTERDVLAMRASGDSQCSIAARYGISQAMVSKIKRRKRWMHL